MRGCRLRVCWLRGCWLRVGWLGSWIAHSNFGVHDTGFAMHDTRGQGQGEARNRNKTARAAFVPVGEDGRDACEKNDGGVHAVCSIEDKAQGGLLSG